MFSSEEREAYRDKMKAQLHQWEARIEELKARKEEAEADARIKLNQQLKEAARQRQEAMKKLRSVPSRPGAFWEDAKGRLQSLGDRMRDTVREAAERVKKRR